MEKSYFFILLFFVSTLSFSQAKCEDADSDLLYAYSHVKSAYNSNNISHLKYYSNRSLEAFERSKEKLKTCGCESAYDLAYDGAKLLAHVENAGTFEDGRFYVKRARDIAQQSIVELDKFTVLTSEEESLLSLKSEKEKLEQLQKELKEKESEIKAKLAAQKQKEAEHNKERLINAYKEAIASNIEAYNKILELCNCDAETLTEIKPNEANLENKGVEEIKLYLLENIKGLTNTYLSRMDIFDED
ncbi:hypothetical protein [Hyunsoonleella aestuarii]|uniref:DUF4398 domain-containing protein n=1 Tax=Hyunsoonleella aestuarii TaxID=912802 RepID=A0ABP8EEF1_9FLAO|nr:hypothetical protein [Hyunsoonleella aestuarii]